jgi:hypothetical protein
MLLVHVCLVANGLNHPDAKPAKLMPPARTLSATIYQFPDAGRILIFEQSQKISLAPGFSPVMIAEARRGAVSTAFARKGNPLKRVLSL